ncbi:MAG: FUSC family protein [Vulcanimicrobiota bacterium]
MTKRISLREIIASELFDSLRLRLALKTAMACLIGEVAVLAFHLSQGYWVIITIFVVMQFTVTTTTKKAAMRIIGTAAGCIVGLAFVALIPERHSLILAVLSFWCVSLLYVSLRGVYPYACLLAALTPMVIVFAGSGHLPGAASLALFRFIDITVGSTIAWLVTIFLLPVNEQNEIKLNSGKLIKRVLAFALTGAEGNVNERIMEQKLKKTLKRQEFLSAAAGISTTPFCGIERYRSVLSVCSFLFIHTIHILNILRQANSSGEDDLTLTSRFQTDIHQFIARLEAIPDAKVMNYLAENRAYIESLHGMLSCRLSSFLSIESEEQKINYRLKISFHIIDALSELSLIGGNAAVYEDGEADIEKSAVMFPGKRLETGSALQALKSTLAVITAAIIWGIPFHNPQAAISALLVSLSSHQSPSYRKMFFRVLGTVLGGLTGLAVMIAVMHIYGVLFILLPLLLFVFSYIGLGDEEWSYIGVAAGICFVLSTSVALSNQESMTVVLHRVEGVVIGGVIAAVVTRFLFPMDYPGKMKIIESELSAIHRRCIETCAASLEGAAVSEKDFLAQKAGLRELTKRYRELIMDYLLDRMPTAPIKQLYLEKAETMLHIYRGIVSLFYALRHITLPPFSRIRKPLGELLGELRKLFPGMEGNLQSGFDESGFSVALFRSREALSEDDRASCDDGQPVFSRESFLYIDVFLRDISILCELCRQVH